MADAKLQIIIDAVDNASNQLSQITNILGVTEKQFKQVAIGATAAGAAIMAGLGVAVNAYVQSGSALSDMADKTGISVEFLGQLRYAAEQSGSSLTAMQTSLRTMSMSLDDASRGSAESARTVRALGLNIRELMSMTPEEQFMAIASALSDMDNKTKQVAAATQIFGRAGTELLPMLRDGSAGLQQMMGDSQRFGAVLSTDAARAAEQLGDSMGNLKGSVQGLVNIVAQQLLPILKPVIDTIADIIVRVTEWMEAHPGLTQAIVIATAAIGGMLFIGGSLLLFLQALVMIGPLVGAAFTIMLGPIGAVILAIAGLIALLVVVIHYWEQITAFFSTIGNILGNLALPAGGAFALPGFAEGGIVTRPTLAMVGEAGPEAIMPLTGPRAGTMGNSYNITISTGAMLGDEADARKFSRMILDNIRNENRQRTYGRNA